jgi:hypothetical protein
MGDQLPSVEGNAEIWRKLWTLQEQIITLQKDQANHQQDIAKQLGEIKDILSQAKGGWRVLLMVGAVVGTVVTIMVELFRRG